MIQSFADNITKDIWNGVNSKAARRIVFRFERQDAFDVCCTDYH